MSTDEAGVVRITLPKIYDEMMGMKEDFADVKALLREHIALEDQRNQGIEVRLENHGSRLADQGTQLVALDGRVTTVEGDLRRMTETQERTSTRRATWPQVVGAVVGIVSGVGVLGSLIVLLANFTSALNAAGVN